MTIPDLDHEFIAPFCLEEYTPNEGDGHKTFQGAYSILARCLRGRCVVRARERARACCGRFFVFGERRKRRARPLKHAPRGRCFGPSCA